MVDFWTKVHAHEYEPKVSYAPFGAGEAFARYRAEEERLTLEFKQDMLAHYGVSDNPKADLAWELAWANAPMTNDDEANQHEMLARFYGILVALIKD